MAAVGAATTFGASGGLAGFVGGTAAAGTATLIGAAEASGSGSSYSPVGNLISSLGSSRQVSRSRRKPKKNDPTGDDFVRELLMRSRN